MPLIILHTIPEVIILIYENKQLDFGQRHVFRHMFDQDSLLKFLPAAPQVLLLVFLEGHY